MRSPELATTRLPKRLQDNLDASGSPISMQRALEWLVAAVNDHDTYTGGHSCRVADYAEALARLTGATFSDTTFIRQAALVHDVGKIGIPDSVLRKKGQLTDQELYLVRLHPIFGASILERLAGMERMIPIVLHHHERWDGNGYPSGRATVDIPYEARVIFAADAFDAMTSSRPYGRTLSPEEALDELRSGAGTQFDPVMVDAMHEAYRCGFLDQPGRRAAIDFGARLSF